MNLYKLTRRGPTSYDEYDAIIVAAENENDAIMIRPKRTTRYDWPRPTVGQVDVELIGEAKPGTRWGVILASYKAG